VNYEIELAPKAEKQFKKLAKDIQKRVSKRIDKLGKNPRPKGVTKLSGEDDIYRVREGDYRIIYAIQDHLLLVLIVKIGHRRDIYRL